MKQWLSTCWTLKWFNFACTYIRHATPRWRCQLRWKRVGVIPSPNLPCSPLCPSLSKSWPVTKVCGSVMRFYLISSMCYCKYLHGKFNFPRHDMVKWVKLLLTHLTPCYSSIYPCPPSSFPLPPSLVIALILFSITTLEMKKTPL